MKNLKHLLMFLLITLFISPNPLHSQIYVGIGPNVINPLSDWSNYNEFTQSVKLQIESRKYCKWWFGLHIDAGNLEKSKDLDQYDEDYFSTFFYFSPSLRYNFLGSRCYDFNMMPYAQITAILSSIDNNNDDDGNIGVGTSLGAGIAYGFHLFDLCWMADLNAQYSMPNIIYSANENRITFQSLNIAVILSVQI